MKACVIGLDCLEPSLVERWLGDLPTFAALRRAGVWGKMRSCVPPITVPAWSCMMSSRDPGALGIYGFRNRTDYSYGGLGFATSEWVHAPRVWDLLGAQGRTAALIGVPGTYPVKPIRGWAIGDFMTPSDAPVWTHPRELRDEILRWLDGVPYLFDVADFRSSDKTRILADIHEMTRRRSRVARAMLREKAPDFLMMVEMGSDRIHHAFWHHSDPQHRKHEPGGPFAEAIHDYYVQLDRELAALLELIDLRETSVVVISDHGAKRLDGGICVNEWLRREGLLVLRSAPPAPGTPLQKCDVDWNRTTAWAEGGYYARIFLNVVGREPQGIVQPADYETMRGEIGHRLARIPDDRGQPLATVWHRPQKLYPRVEGIAPDLIVIFGDLHWRAVGSLGFDAIHTFENDTGPDEANHAQHGYFSWTAPGLTPSPEPQELDILDVAPTLLRQLGLPLAPGMQGTVRDFAPATPKAPPAAPAPPSGDAGGRYTEQQQAEIEQRLAALGYLG